MRKLKNSELNRITVDEFKQNEKIPLVVVLDNIRSLSNVGSVFRTSDAFLVKEIILCGITATPPHKEIQKTALGATDSVDWRYFETTLEAAQKLKEEAYQLWAIEQVDEKVWAQDFVFPKGEKLAVIFGNEVKGLSKEIIPHLDGCIEIPQFGTKHSLNVSISAGIILWELFRQYKYEK